MVPYTTTSLSSQLNYIDCLNDCDIKSIYSLYRSEISSCRQKYIYGVTNGETA